MQENDGKSKIQSKICFRSCNSSNKANYVMLKGKKAAQEIEIGILSYEIPLIWSQKVKNKEAQLFGKLAILFKRFHLLWGLD